MWICLCFIHTMSPPWLNPLFLYVHLFIPVFIYCQWSCRHCGLLSVYKVNSCFKSNKVYYINSFREFGNDIACSKLAVVTGVSIRMPLNKWRRVKDKLSGNVSLLLLPAGSCCCDCFIHLQKTAVDSTVQISLTWHNTNHWQ